MKKKPLMLFIALCLILICSNSLADSSKLPIVKAINIEQKKATLLVGASEAQAQIQLSCTIEPQDAYAGTILWSSSNEKVAVVDANGLVKGVARGQATITAEAADAPARPKARVHVTVAQAVTGITLDAEQKNIPAGRTAALKASVEPKNAGSKKLVWASSDQSVATVSAAGQVKGKANGTAIITASAADGSGVSAVCAVTVVTPVHKIALSEKTITVPKGLTYQVTADVAPSDATVKGLIWSSANEKVATVDENGVITGTGKGNCQITAEAADGSGKKASIAVKVAEFDVLITKAGEQPIVRYEGLSGSGIFMTDWSSQNDCVIIHSGDERNTLSLTPVKAGADKVTVVEINALNRKKAKIEWTVYVAPSALEEAKKE